MGFLDRVKDSDTSRSHRSSVGMHLATLQRGVRDAGASENAFPRGAWERGGLATKGGFKYLLLLILSGYVGSSLVT